MSVNLIFAALAVLSLALAFWQFLAARKFPLHERIADPAFSPAISLLKPLKGCDATTGDSLQSWFTQNYGGPVQILFGVASADDPVCDQVRELLKKNPNADAQLVVCGETLGTNAKVSTLIQLEKQVKHDLVLVSDADVRVPQDFLANVVAPLRDPKTELVNCFYRLANPMTTAMQWEAIQVNADFWSGVLQSQTLKPLDFAMGAAILVRRKSLDALGGFKALANSLADDYQIGNRVTKNGGKIALCPVVVDCWDAPMGWREAWKHQLRWARTIRVCMPTGYFLSILTDATLWPLLWFIVALVATKTICAPLTAVAFILIRIAIVQNLQRRFLESHQKPAPFWLVPVKDLLQLALWAGAFCGNQIEWRSRKMRLRPNGDLEPVRQ
jgi:ceramide glucosyltransferase